MSFFLKGSQHQFIFSKKDAIDLVSWIFELDYILFEDYVNREDDKTPIKNIEKFQNILKKEEYIRYNDVPQFFVVPKSFSVLAFWNKINLKEGGIKYELDPMNSHAVQLLLSRQNKKRIGVGRISFCREWEDKIGRTINTTDIENEVYKDIKKIIRKLSAGKIGNIMIGKDACELAKLNKIQLAYDLNNPDFYKLEYFKALK